MQKQETEQPTNDPEVKEKKKMLAIKNLTAQPKIVESYEVIHPLYDVQEEKMRGENLGKMKLTPTVKFSLFLLRAYIIVMGGLLIYHVLDLAGLFGHHAK